MLDMCRGKRDWVIAKCNEQKTEDSIIQEEFKFTSQMNPIHEATAALSESMKQSVPANNPEPKARRTHEQNQRPAQIEMLRIQLRGIPESTEADQRKKLESDLAEVKKAFTFNGVQCTVTDTVRLGKPVKNKTRTIIARASQIWEKRLILFSLAKLKDYPSAVYTGPNLTREKAAKENERLK